MAAGRPETFDHLRKKPLEQRVRIFLDDESIEELTDARAELADAEVEANNRYDARLRLARQSATGADLLTIEAGLDRERTEALAPYRAAVTAAEDKVRASCQWFVFRSPGRKAFEDLIAEHPPTDEDHDDARKMSGRPEALSRWHTDTFIPALIAATCIDPKISVEQAQQMYLEWNDAEIGELTAAALAVCQGARQVDVGKASPAARKRG